MEKTESDMSTVSTATTLSHGSTSSPEGDPEASPEDELSEAPTRASSLAHMLEGQRPEAAATKLDRLHDQLLKLEARPMLPPHLG